MSSCIQIEIITLGKDLNLLSEEGNKYLEFRDTIRDFFPLMLEDPDKFVVIEGRMMMDYWLSYLDVKKYMPPEIRSSNIWFDYCSVFMRKGSRLERGVNGW